MGERLWHEEAKLRSPPGRDLEDLWECAAEMMDPVRKEAAASRLEQLIADHPELDYPMCLFQNSFVSWVAAKASHVSALRASAMAISMSSMNVRAKTRAVMS